MDESVARILGLMEDSLRQWAKRALKTVAHSIEDRKISANIVSFYRPVLREINLSIEDLRKRLKVAYENLKDLEAEHSDPFAQLTVAYLSKHLALRAKIKDVLDLVHGVVVLYSDKVAEAKAATPNYSEYLSEKNEKALDLLYSLNEDTLLKMLAGVARPLDFGYLCFQI